MSSATTVQEMKWGRMMTLWLTFLKYLFLISDRAMAIRMATKLVARMNRVFRSRVLTVTRTKSWEPKKKRKLSRKTNSDPKIPLAGLYFWKAMTRPSIGA